MSVVHTQVDGGGNNVRQQAPGDTPMEMLQFVPLTTIGAGQLTAAMIVGGVIERTGPVGAYIDTLPTVADLLAAIPVASPGDSFNLYFRNTVAFAMTLAVGLGWTLDGANTGVPASNTRLYVITILTNKPAQLYAGNTTNASPTVTGFTAAQLNNLMPGMAVTGTGIPASTTIIGVSPDAGTITLSANATATGSLVGLTFLPTAKIKGVFTAAL